MTNSREFAHLMSALITDIIDDTIDVARANAICNAGGKLLKIVELQHKYGKEKAEPVLALAPKE